MQHYVRDTVALQSCLMGRRIVPDGVYDAFGKQSGFAHPQMYELFDLAKDPYELLNIYNSTKSDGSAGQALLTELHGILRQYYECSGPECP